MTSVTLTLNEIAAILAGRQAVLRRPVDPQPPVQIYYDGIGCWYPTGVWGGQDWFCPFGRAGDVLNFDEFSLEVLGAGIEQVQDISENSAMADGIDDARMFLPGEINLKPTQKEMKIPLLVWRWQHRWDKLHPAFPWASNPWTWIARVERVE